ncbi:hypothetical protein E5673_08280 [Sphingomonas sp. PAMC26645]|uniref:head-tail joining protein n=1 Tax=Sphingomonas sp. PAMC26645 TaxID=2565555 RepID=UPI00109DCC82|nr:hypothetical protein [Sphingomonas sp. PAMC26645]QCB42230.1 hypothetical protein E5673_08280 [Sphingomonas sp. PAMC26645]
MNFADDLAVFFNPEEHGEAIRYNGVGEISAIWNRPSGVLEANGSSFVVATNSFLLPITQVARPVLGDTITVVRTLEQFTIDGEPRLNGDGTIWTCEVS